MENITLSPAELKTIIASAIHENNEYEKQVVEASKDFAADNVKELGFELYKDKLVDAVKCGTGALVSYLGQLMRLQVLVIFILSLIVFVVVVCLVLKCLYRALDNMWHDFTIER